MNSNTDEFWKHYIKRKETQKKSHILWSYLHEMPIKGKLDRVVHILLVCLFVFPRQVFSESGTVYVEFTGMTYRLSSNNS